MPISIHQASRQERLIAHQSSFESWGNGRSVEDYLTRCTTSLRHNRATWWVLCQGEQVISALCIHPLRFWSSCRIVHGFGIGSVHTRVEFRGQGHAFQLCTTVMAYERRQGAKIGLLFTDVSPEYYGTMGFQLCDDHSYECHDIPALARRPCSLQLVSLDPMVELDRLLDSHDAQHQRRSLSLARDKDGWEFSLRHIEDEPFLAILDPIGHFRGYVRYYQDDERLIPTELVFQEPPAGELVAEAFVALAQRADRARLSRLYGWLKPPDQIGAAFRSTRREKSRPMIWLDSSLHLDSIERDDIRFYGTDYF